MPLISIEVLARLVSVRVFVESEVGQVHEYIVFVVFGRSGVALRAEASESHLMQVNPQRLNTVQQNIQSKIVLKVVDQVGSVDVLLNHIVGLKF